MNKDYADLTIVLDRSGSMRSCQKDAEGGLNALIDEQKRQPGRATLTLIQFDDQYECVCRGIDVQNAVQYPLVPRGNTALLDAVGRAVAETGERLAAMPEADRPGLVAFVIVTDGQENASREYTKAKVAAAIRHQQEAYGWHFTFLGANQDAFAEAGGIGIPRATAMNYAEEKTGGVIKTYGAKLKSARSASAKGEAVDMAFTDEERADAAK